MYRYACFKLSHIPEKKKSFLRTKLLNNLHKTKNKTLPLTYSFFFYQNGGNNRKCRKPEANDLRKFKRGIRGITKRKKNNNRAIFQKRVSLSAEAIQFHTRLIRNADFPPNWKIWDEKSTLFRWCEDYRLRLNSFFMLSLKRRHFFLFLSS